MVSVPLSAFEAYQNQKMAKKKAKNERRISKKKKVQLNPLVTAELLKAVSEEGKKKKAAAPSTEKVDQLVKAEEPLIKFVQGALRSVQILKSSKCSC